MYVVNSPLVNPSWLLLLVVTSLSPCEILYLILGPEPMCWDSNPAQTQFGSQTQAKACLGLEPSQKPD